jgi:hypothetical protein
MIHMANYGSMKDHQLLLNEKLVMILKESWKTTIELIYDIFPFKGNLTTSN